MNARVLLKTIAVFAYATCGFPQTDPPTFEDYLRKSAVDRKTIELFLDPVELSWAKFDPVTGYRLGNYMPRDGIDRSYTISTARTNGMRSAQVYADKPCRINSYGNSFTQCHQVSDGETWQEYLAAHLGEPIRNFGVGGFGSLPNLSANDSHRTDRSRREVCDILYLG